MTGFTYPEEVGGQGGEAWQERMYEEEAANYEASSGFIRLDDRHARPDAHGLRHRSAAA